MVVGPMSEACGFIQYLGVWMLGKEHVCGCVQGVKDVCVCVSLDG